MRSVSAAELQEKSIHEVREQEAQEAVDDAIRIMIADLGTSGSAWRQVQRALKRGDPTTNRAPIDMSVHQVQNRFIASGGIMCDMPRPKLEKVEVKEPPPMSDIQEWLKECKDRRDDLKRITQSHRHGDEWDLYFKQTKFREPIRTLALPKSKECIAEKIYSKDSVTVVAVGDGRYFPDEQRKLLNGLVAQRAEPPTALPHAVLPEPHQFGATVSLAVVNRRGSMPFNDASMGLTQMSDQMRTGGKQRLPFKFCKLHLPHSAFTHRDVIILKTRDTNPGKHSKWSVVDRALYTPSHSEIMLTVRDTGTWCVAQQHGTDQVVALSAYVSSLGNILIGRSNKCSIALTFNHKASINDNKLTALINACEAAQPGRKQYWPGKVSVGKLMHVRTEIGGTIRLFPIRAVATALKRNIMVLKPPDLSSEKPTNTTFKVGQRVLIRMTRADIMNLFPATVTDVHRDRVVALKQPPTCYYDVEYADPMMGEELLVREWRVIDRGKLEDSLQVLRDKSLSAARRNMLAQNVVELKWNNQTTCGFGELAPPPDAEPAADCTDPTSGECRLACSIVVQTVSNAGTWSSERANAGEPPPKKENWYEFKLQVGVAWNKRLQECVGKLKKTKDSRKEAEKRAQARQQVEEKLQKNKSPSLAALKVPGYPMPKGLVPKGAFRGRILPLGDSLDSIMDPVTVSLGLR